MGVLHQSRDWLGISYPYNDLQCVKCNIKHYITRYVTLHFCHVTE